MVLLLKAGLAQALSSYCVVGCGSLLSSDTADTPPLHPTPLLALCLQDALTQSIFGGGMLPPNPGGVDKAFDKEVRPLSVTSETIGTRVHVDGRWGCWWTRLRTQGGACSKEDEALHLCAGPGPVMLPTSPPYAPACTHTLTLLRLCLCRSGRCARRARRAAVTTSLSWTPWVCAS